MNRFSEKDWKIFRSKIAGWQEAYMDKLNKEYIEILKNTGGQALKARSRWKNCFLTCHLIAETRRK